MYNLKIDWRKIMTFLVLPLLCLTTVCLCSVKSEINSANFPFHGCHTDDMDILCLYYIIRDGYGEYMCDMFIKHLLSFPHNKSTPRVLFAGVYDWYSVNNPNVNVSSWHLRESYKFYSYGYKEKQAWLQTYNSINETVKLKVKFVQRLFSEMGRVRKNVTRLAVIFIDGYGLSYEERRTVPHILHKLNSDIKVFAVVLDVRYENEIVHLKDTLLVDYFAEIPHKHMLALAMCNQCLGGWWKLDHSVGTELMSCYRMLKSDKGRNSDDTYSTCWDNDDSKPVTIESTKQLTYLQGRINSYLHEQRSGSEMQFSAQFFIGLKRSNDNIARRFSWQLFERFVTRPLLVNNWLPDKPSGGYINECVVWQFDWSKDINGDFNISRNEDGLVDGWVDVDCDFASSFVLCEASLTRRIEVDQLIRIKPATNESFTQALNSGGFVRYRGNIVSVSINFNDKDFVKFLQQIKYELFPLFDCGEEAASSRYISYTRVCDFSPHCSNGRDEDFCWQSQYDEWETDRKYCNGISCSDGSCLLLQWVNDGEVDCPVCKCSPGKEFNDESEILHKYLKRNETCAFICNNDECIHFSQLNDGHIDCTRLEGPLDETIGKLETADTCHNVHGHSIWAPKCAYVRDMYGAVLGCRDMSHLVNCTNFECPTGYVKCPSTYCIPQHYVLDEKQDCPTGEDEQIDNVVPCTGNFACWNSKVCLHPDLVCNGYRDCPHEDDEVDCNLNCTEGFRCVSGTVSLSSINKPVSLATFPSFHAETKYVDSSRLDLSTTLFKKLLFPENVLVIKLSDCNISSIYIRSFRFLLYLQDVDISYNRLQIIHDRDNLFAESQSIRSLNVSHNRELVYVKLQFPLLEILDLSHTNLSFLENTFFEDLPFLKYLDLSFTVITSFHKNVFPFRLNLRSLDLRGLPMDSFREDFFNGLTISQHLYTDSFELCCPQIRGNNIPQYMCYSPTNAISSCFDLIGTFVQRVLLWVVAILAVSGNMSVIVYRIIWDRSSLRTGYGLFVTNLGISDFIMGAYLFIITGADYYYRGIYVLYDKLWRESIICQFAGFLATLSAETSIFLICLITLDRFLIMKFPFGQVKFSKLGKTFAVLLSWIIALLIALTPLVFKLEINSSNAMCIGLPLTTKQLIGWEFSFGVFIVLNNCLCFVLAYGQRAIFRAMSGNRIGRTSTNSSSRRAEDIIVAKQLSLVALFNFLCWFPIGFIGLLSLVGHETSDEVFAWTTVIVLPINAAVNPFLYTIPVLIDKWMNFRFGGKNAP